MFPNTATDKGDILPLEPNCIDADNQNAMNMAENAVSDNDDEDNSSQCSSDTDDIADDDDDDELQHPVSCDSDSRGEQALVIASPVLNVKEKLDKSVECTEANSPQHLVLTVCKITEEWRMQALQERELIQTVQNFQEDTGPAVDNCDDSESEDEADCLDYHEQEEEFKFYGAVPKSDDSGTTEAIMTVEQHHNVIESDDRLASHAEPAEEAVQGHTGEGVNGEEVNNDSGNQQATSTISSSVAHGTFPNSTTPND